MSALYLCSFPCRTHALVGLDVVFWNTRTVRGPGPGLRPAEVGEKRLQEVRLKRNANPNNRDAILLCSLSGRSGAPVVRIDALRAAASRSSTTILSTLARISSVGSTQSMGIELQRSVGQLTRSAPLPRVPPVTWICWPVMILPQTRQ